MNFFQLSNYSFDTHANITGDHRLGNRVFMPTDLQQTLIANADQVLLELQVDFESDNPTWQPEIEIQIGNKHSIVKIEHAQTITIAGSLPANSNLAITLLNQPADKTHFWTGGDHNHYSCRQVLIKGFKLNGVDLIKLGHLDKYFKQDLIVDSAGEARIRELECWPITTKHLWRLWTNMTVHAWFDYPVTTQLCAWALDQNADQTPDWAVMNELKKYLVDFDQQNS